MANAKPMPTPMLTCPKLSATDGLSFDDPTLYRSIVGGLSNATITTPDIAHDENKVS